MRKKKHVISIPIDLPNVKKGSMPRQDNLLQLIKSLDTNQRRYFKLFSNLQAGEKKYVQLFELLEAKESYDAAELSALLAVSKPQLAVIKNYLTNALLKSIRIYKEDGEPDARLLAVAQDAQELMKLSLFDFATQILDKAIAEARRDERLEVLTRLLSVKHTCLFHGHNYSLAAQVGKEYEIANRMCAEYMQLRGWVAQITPSLYSQIPTTEFDAIIGQVEKDGTNLLTFRAAVEYYTFCSTYYHVIKSDTDNVMEICRKAITHFEATPHMQHLCYGNYLSMHDKLAAAELTKKNYENCWTVNERAIQLAAQAPATVPASYLIVFSQHVQYRKVEVLLALHKYDKALMQIKEMNTGTRQLPLYLKAILLFHSAVALMQLNRTKEAYEKLNEMLTISDEQLDILARARVMMVGIQLEMENFEVVPYLIRTAKAWLKRKKVIDPEYNLFFSLTYSIAKASPQKRHTRWQLLSQALNEGKMPQLNADENFAVWLQRNLSRTKSRPRLKNGL